MNNYYDNGMYNNNNVNYNYNNQNRNYNYNHYDNTQYNNQNRNTNNTFISNNKYNNQKSNKMYIQIPFTKYQTNKKLIEFIHTDVPGKIWIRMLDYSQGTGSNTISVSAYIKIETLIYIAQRIILGISFGSPIVNKNNNNYNNNYMKLLLMEQKILAHKKNNQNRSPVTTLIINENAPTMNLKYKISITNGTGIAYITKTGGTACQKGSYVKEKEVTIDISDNDLASRLVYLLKYIEMNKLLEQEIEKKVNEQRKNYEIFRQGNQTRR